MDTLRYKKIMKSTTHCIASRFYAMFKKGLRFVRHTLVLMCYSYAKCDTCMTYLT